MNEYHVKWEVVIDAVSPEEAAQKCLQILRDMSMKFQVFEVRPASESVFVYANAEEKK